jgi:hypothetical protein
MPSDAARLRAGSRFPAVLVVATLIALPALLVRPISDPSPWLHLKVGQYLLDGHRFGLPDPWAPFASHAYVPTQWLPSVLTAALHPHLGDGLIAWERAAGITLLWLALLWWGRRLTRLWLALVVSTVVVAAAWPSLTERPQVAGFILLVPVLAAWWRTAHDGRPRWWLIPLTWLAASTHGIWSTGLAVGGVVGVLYVLSGRATRRSAGRLAALLAGCAVAAAVTPVGPRLLLTPFAVSGQGRQFVAEWLPSSVRSPHVLAALALLAAAWLCWVLTQHRPTVVEVALLLVGTALALTMQRTVAVAGIVALPLVCTAVERILSRREQGATDHHLTRRVPWRGWTVAALAGLALAVPVAARADSPREVPTALLPQLTVLPDRTRVVADGDTTGWLLFSAPQLDPVYELRVESYTAEQVEDFIAAMAADPGWDSYLREHDVTVALLRTKSPLRAALTEQWHWTEVGHDAGLVLLEAPR